MKHLPSLLVAAAAAWNAAVAPSPAQAPSPADPAPAAPAAAGEFPVKEFIVWPDFIPPRHQLGLPGGEVAGSALPPLATAREYLERQGVAFPPGATASYVPGRNRLIVRNTQENLDLVAEIVSAATKQRADPFLSTHDAPPAAGGGRAWVNLTMVLELYALDRDAALAVLDAERGSAARYRRVLELLQAGQARLDTLTAITTKSGQRAIVEAIDEVRYATEFAPPARPGALATPRVYETRNVGDSFELEPVLGPDGTRCDLNFVPQKVTLLGFRDTLGMAGDAPVGSPLFHTQKVTTSATLPIGAPHFFGTMSPPGERGPGLESWLGFVRAHVSGPTAEEAKPPAKLPEWPVINLDYAFYSLERVAAREILASASDFSAPWKKLDALVREKKARREHQVLLQTKSGQRSVVEEMRETRYAAEYEPASSAQKTTRVTTTRPGGPETKNPEKSEGRTTTTTETITVTPPLSSGEVVPGSPVAFETRNVGVTIEVEPVVGPDGVTVDLNHVPQLVAHLGDLKATGAAAGSPPQPLFATRKLTTSQSLLAGQWALAGTLSHPGANGVNERVDDGRTWLLFVRATPGEP